MSLAVMLHIAGGGLAILAGFAALSVRKGDTLHRTFGRAFMASMVVMLVLALVMAMKNGQAINIVAASFTLYLVATAWATIKRPPGRFEQVAMMAGAVIAIGAFVAAGQVGDFRAVLYVFGALVAFGVGMDARVLRRGLSGRGRLCRHIWRVCLALAIAAGSFFLGQADEIPQAFRGPHLSIPPLLALAALVFWQVKTRWRPRARFA